MSNSSTHVQDATTGRLEVVLERLGAMFRAAGEYTNVDIAVAYASRRGVDLLNSSARGGASWGTAKKRILVSIDSGFTEPEALDSLAALEHAEVRVPRGKEVLRRPQLRPVRAFHPKCFVVRGSSAAEPAALLIGSANLTGSALTTGTEVVSEYVWPAGYQDSTLQGMADYLAWFDEAWEKADPLAGILDAYRTARSQLDTHAVSPGDQDSIAVAYDPGSDDVIVDGREGALLAAARALYIEAGSLSQNLGRGLPGNQLDTRRGTRVFFGFPADTVIKNTVLGQIEVRFETGSYQRFSVRFGDNMMDKVNLPIPGSQGPESYDGKTLLFARDELASDGTPRFTLSTPVPETLDQTISLARRTEARALSSGRRWGLLF